MKMVKEAKKIEVVASEGKKSVNSVEKLTNFTTLLEKHEETIPDGIPWFLATLIFVNALVGAGILNFPYSIHAAGGIFIAICVQSVMVIMLYFSVSTMIWCSHICKSSFYQDTVFEYLGSPGRYLCSVLMLIYCYLLTTTYTVAIGQQLGAGMKVVFGHNQHWYLSEPFLLAIVGLVIIFPFCLVRSIDKLHIASAVASVTVLLVIAVVIYEFYHIDHGPVRTTTRPENWGDVFLSVPAYAIAYMFDLASVAIYGRLKNKTMGNFMKASALAMGSVFIFYNVFSIYAYLTFGDKIHPNFMTNYSQGSWVIAFAQFAYSLKLCLEYPVFQFLGWTAIHTFITGCSVPVDEGEKQGGFDKMRFLTSVIWITSTFLISFFAPSINYVLPLASATVLHFQFTFPGLCLLRALNLVNEYLSSTKIFLLQVYGVILVLFGFCLSAVLFVQYFTIERH